MMPLPDKDRAENPPKPRLVHARGAHRSERDSWNSLKLFLLYRIGISFVLLLLHSFGALPLGESASDQRLFLLAAEVLFAVNLLLAPIVFLPNMPFRHLVSAQVIIDIIAFSVMMYASTGLESGIGLLVVPSIAGASLLLPGNMAPFYAAFATLAVFVQAGVSILHGRHELFALTQAGIQGSIFFAVAILAMKMARKALASEELAWRRGQDFADLSQLTRHIVEQMDTAVIVTGKDGRIRLINKAAWELLGHDSPRQQVTISDLSPALQTLVERWLQDRKASSLRGTAPSGREFEAKFIPIGSGRQRAILIFLDDLTRRSRQLHEVKLAALGRLTASIAHEIRNPLGAISHAAQLLQESEALSDPDRRLANIIQSNTQRMNQLIESVLNLSRRRSPDTRQLDLTTWLQQTLTEFLRQHELGEDSLTLNSTAEVQVDVDAQQLHQILWNLLRNAQIHSGTSGNLHIEVRLGTLDGRASIDVIDNGATIPPNLREQLFEPFFSTDSRGTGLGLYLARELAEANGGSLEYSAPPAGGNCFRIRLPLSSPAHAKEAEP